MLSLDFAHVMAHQYHVREHLSTQSLDEVLKFPSTCVGSLVFIMFLPMGLEPARAVKQFLCVVISCYFALVGMGGGWGQWRSCLKFMLKQKFSWSKLFRNSILDCRTWRDIFWGLCVFVVSSFVTFVQLEVPFPERFLRDFLVADPFFLEHTLTLVFS